MHIASIDCIKRGNYCTSTTHVHVQCTCTSTTRVHGIHIHLQHLQHAYMVYIYIYNIYNTRTSIHSQDGTTITCRSFSVTCTCSQDGTTITCRFLLILSHPHRIKCTHHCSSLSLTSVSPPSGPSHAPQPSWGPALPPTPALA